MKKINSLKILFLAVLIAFFNTALSMEGASAMELTSTAFGNNQTIPRQYTCKGEDINPPLAILEIPNGTKSLALIVDDPDAPMGTWVHWVVFNLPPSTDSIAQDSVPGSQAGNDFGRETYGGPCPPSGTHRYFFKVYALDTTFEPQIIKSKADLEKAMDGHVLDQAQLIGLFKK